jgi:isochorismate synthase
MLTPTDFFDQIEAALHSKRSFVLFSKPGQHLIKSYIQLDSECYIINDFTESGFVFAPFERDKDSYYIPTDKSSLLEIESAEFEISSLSNTLNTKDDSVHHIDLVSKAIKKIKLSELEKVVVSRAVQCILDTCDPIKIFKNLFQKYPSAFTYCWYHPKTGFWFGASPERLLKLEGKNFSTMSLAGTQPYKGSREIYWDKKNHKEHAFVTDYLLDALNDYLDGIKSIGPSTIKAGDLLHLQTLITGRLRSSIEPLNDLIRILHPTPAVCGTPRELALDFIRSSENYDREYYTGFFGELNISIESMPRNSKRNVENRAYQTIKESTDLAVNLRCMKLINSTAILYSGGGITKDSDPEQECIEIHNKIQTVKSIL